MAAFAESTIHSPQSRRVRVFSRRPQVVYVLWPLLMGWLLLASLPRVHHIAGRAYLSALAVAGLVAGLDLARRTARAEFDQAEAARPGSGAAGPSSDAADSGAWDAAAYDAEATPIARRRG